MKKQAEFTPTPGANPNQITAMQSPIVAEFAETSAAFSFALRDGDYAEAQRIAPIMDTLNDMLIAMNDWFIDVLAIAPAVLPAGAAAASAPVVESGTVPALEIVDPLQELDDTIIEAVADYRHCQQWEKRVAADKRDCAAGLKPLLVEWNELTGEKWTDSDGYAEITADYNRVSYDAAAVDALVTLLKAARPGKQATLAIEALEAARKETAVSGGVRVK